MKIISWNVNGIRAVERKGELGKFLKKYYPDVFFIQETKAKKEQLSDFLTNHEDYEQFYHSAVKPGYSGTAVWVRRSISKKVNFFVGMDDFDDVEGRVCGVELDNDWVIFGVYFPNGGKSDEAWEGKLIFYEKFLKYVNKLRKKGKKIIFTGDVNCAHKEIDLARPEGNKNSIGFLPEERKWISKVILYGWEDVFRKMYSSKVAYSWWHYFTRARERNVGWRIDYFFIDHDFFYFVKDIEYLSSQLGSDHCPVLLDVNLG